MYKLIGSLPSPYVRRVRLVLEELNLPYEFQTIDVMSSEGQEILSQFSIIRRVPVLIDEKTQEVYTDSGLITQFLRKDKFDYREEEIKLLINEACASALTILQLSRFKLDESGESIIAKNHQKRVNDILDYFENHNEVYSLEKFEIIEQWLFCMLDWFEFRELAKWKDKNNLVDFYEAHVNRDAVKKTNPRQ